MEVIRKYFKELTTDQDAKFNELRDLYSYWNERINVISRKDMDQFYTRHVLHALSLARLNKLEGSEKVMDIGTGGGFPGIPLAIMYPDIEFTLVDSIAKKTRVEFEVAESLDLENVLVVNDRFEKIKDKHDTIVSRAVAPASKLVQLTKKALASGGKHVFLKGGDLVEEQYELLQRHPKAQWQEEALRDVFDEDFFETKKVITLKL